MDMPLKSHETRSKHVWIPNDQAMGLDVLIGCVNDRDYGRYPAGTVMLNTIVTGEDKTCVIFSERGCPWNTMYSTRDDEWKPVVDLRGRPIYPLADFSDLLN